MEQKELERSEKDIQLEDILNDTPETSEEAETEVSVGETASEENTSATASADEAGGEENAVQSDEEQPEDEEHSEEDGEQSEEDSFEDEYEEEVPKKKKRKKRGHGHIIFGLILSAVIISISILAAVFILKCAKEFVGIDKSDIELVVEIPMNSSTADIAELLYNEGIVSDPKLFRLFSKIKGADGTYIAGTHTLSPNMDYNTLIETLQEEVKDPRETVDIVFPEGITLFEAAQKLEEKGVCNADEFLKTFNLGGLGFDFEEKVKTSSLKFYKFEGYLFPDTYQFYADDDPRVVAKKIYRNFDARITPDIYGRMEDLEMELEEVLTLASIVQAEAANTRDMKKVASVFYNRLNNPDEYPLLQSDPTTNYVDEIIKPNIQVKSESMFKAYDTYQGAGLPPGPICNPGLDAINAVLYPEETDYYYFCSNLETGEFYYAETLDEHNQNLIEAGLAE